MEECDCLINQSETGYYSHITCTDLTAHDPSQVQYCGEESHHAYATALSTAPTTGVSRLLCGWATFYWLLKK